jgi:hypothetical protein
MNTEHKAVLLWRVLQSIIISTLLLALFTALVCWFGGWRTLLAYGNRLVYTGGALLFIGCLMFIGGQSQTYHHQGSKHGFNPMPIDDREVLNFENSKQRRVDVSDAIRSSVALVFPAILCIIIGLILVSIID